MERGSSIPNPQNNDARRQGSAASLLFAPGERPDASAIAELSLRSREFSISFDPVARDGATDAFATDQKEEAGNWLELLANGLTFDLAGLRPGSPSATPAKRHGYGLSPQVTPEGLEAITLQPGPHLAGGGALLPIVRSLAWLTAQLAVLPGVRAVAWHPAGCWSDPQQFRNFVLDWIAGGPFPMFSLAALAPSPDGGFLTDGLSLFTGQELSSSQALEGLSPNAALRLAHWLVENGRVTRPETVTGPDGDAFCLEPSVDYPLVTVRKL